MATGAELQQLVEDFADDLAGALPFLDEMGGLAKIAAGRIENACSRK